jgi:beta-lactamase superfamily II metal-dependent hydrolase
LRPIPSRTGGIGGRRFCGTSVLQTCACLVVIIIFFIFVASAAAKAKPLQIYFIDVEGGQATLVVSPSGQSMLVDTGWADFDGRDANRIAAAAKVARIKRIDYVVITHYHGDHVGGVEQLAARMKIGSFVDHGTNQEDSDAARKNYTGYLKAAAHTGHAVVGPNDGLPLKGITVQVLTAAGEHISQPLPGAGTANPYCDQEADAPVDASENARSLGILITYGRFRFIDLGDLTKKKELELMCPDNLVGAVDLFLVSHHGNDDANSKALVDALHPRVAILNNGAHKGGNPQAWQRVHDSPGLEDLWQLHYAVDAGEEHNVPQSFIANPQEDEKADAGSYIKVLAEPDGTFTVTNSRNRFHKTYRRH